MASPQLEILLEEPSQRNAGVKSGRLSNQRNFYETFFQDWWLAELLFVLLGIIANVGLCVLVAKYDGKSAPESNAIGSVNITLNTVVSVLSTVGRAALLLPVSECISQLKWTWFTNTDRPLEDLSVFDNASRGAWGGLQLLWKINIRQMASIGALLVVMGLAVDPLSQQLIHYEVLRVPGPYGSANLSAAVVWDDTYPGRNAYAFNSKIYDPPLLMKAAILNGLFAGNIVVDNTEPDCPGGNCTWPSYCSLAICTRSADVTSYIRTKEVTVNSGYGGGATKWYLNKRNFLLDDGLVLMNLSSAATVGVSTDAGLTTPSLNFSNSIAFQNSSAPLADVFLIYENPKNSRNFSATEFMLEWCVQNFTTSVTNGTSTTQRHLSFSDFSANGDIDIEAHPNCSQNRTYKIELQTHHILLNYLSDLFQGYVTTTYSSDLLKTTDAAQALFEPFNMWDYNGEDVFSGRGLGQAGLRRIIENIATGMTNMVRHSEYRSPSSMEPMSEFNGTIQGHADYLVTFVKVQWGWIAAPVIFLVGSVLFVLTTIASSRPPSRRLDIWKSSSLPVLQALNLELRRDLSGMRHLSDLERRAKDTPVRLIRDYDNGWGLVRRSSSMRQSKTKVSPAS